MGRCLRALPGTLPPLSPPHLFAQRDIFIRPTPLHPRHPRTVYPTSSTTPSLPPSHRPHLSITCRSHPFRRASLRARYPCVRPMPLRHTPRLRMAKASSRWMGEASGVSSPRSSCLRCRKHLPEGVDVRSLLDLVGGTSTGGVAALIYARLGVSGEKCLDTYEEMPQKLFAKRGEAHAPFLVACHECATLYCEAEEALRTCRPRRGW